MFWAIYYWICNLRVRKIVIGAKKVGPWEIFKGLRVKELSDGHEFPRNLIEGCVGVLCTPLQQGSNVTTQNYFSVYFFTNFNTNITNLSKLSISLLFFINYNYLKFYDQTLT